jgi:amino acid transporter
MSGRFRHKLGLFSLVALIFASLSGGPFGLEDMVPDTGPGMAFILLVVAAMVWCVPMILASAELGSAMPIEGGYYRWTRRALGDFWGFQAGWWVWMSSLLDQAIYPVLMVSFLERFLWPGLRAYQITVLGFEFEWLSWLICMSVIIPCGVINVRGARSVGTSSIVLDVLILGPYALFVALAFLQWRFNPFTPLTPPGETITDALGYGLLFAMWNYSGYELPSTAAEEVENPSVTLPRGLFLAVPVVMASYMLPLAAALAVRDDWSTWSEGTFVDIARDVGAIFPGGADLLPALITLATIAGTTSLFNGLLLPYTRIQFAMAEDRFLPAPLARLHSRHSTPWVSILFNCAIYSVLVLLPFQDLLTVDVWLLSPAYSLVYLALIVMRWREPGMPRPFRIRGSWMTLLAVSLPPWTLAAVAAWQSGKEVVAADPVILWFGVACVASGPIAYGISILGHRLRGTRPLPVQIPSGGAPSTPAGA